MKDIVNLSNITKSFGDNSVLKGVSFDMTEGEIVGLIGPSGGGKSVLMKIMGQVLSADSGEINFHDLTTQEISLMFQEGALFDSLNVFDNVAFPLVDGNVPSTSLPKARQEELAEQVLGILAKVGLAEAYRKYSAQLSGGMRRRVSLARSLVADPKLALLDDPTSGLDPVASNVIMDLIQRVHRQEGTTMLIASQDLRRLIPYVDRIIALFDGKVVYDGPSGSKDLLGNAEVSDFISCRYDLA